jgi:hypothetical protein
MTRFACIIVVLVAGCSFDEAALRVPAPDAGVDALILGVPGHDAGSAPDLRAMPDAFSSADLGAPNDVKLQTADALPVSDAKALPDGLSYPHDVVVATGVPCMQQVIANGYASEKASCATWVTAKVVTPWTSQTACVALIDCYVTNPTSCSNWSDGACPCLNAAHYAGPTDFGPLRDIVEPFCPNFFAVVWTHD